MTTSTPNDRQRHPSAHRLDRPLVVPSRVRRWAAERGIEVGKRGRIPAAVVEQYRTERRAS